MIDALAVKPLQETRRSVIETAMQLFAERGYDGVSIRDITRTLELTPGAIYHHFGSKKDLYDEVVVAAFEEVMVQLTEPGSPSGTPQARLHAVIERLAAFIWRAPIGMQMVDRVIFEAQVGLTGQVSGIVDRTHEALASIIREIDPDCSAAAYAEHLLAAVYGAHKLRPIREKLTAATGVDAPEGLAASLTEFTLRALRAPTPASERKR